MKSVIGCNNARKSPDGYGKQRPERGTDRPRRRVLKGIDHSDWRGNQRGEKEADVKGYSRALHRGWPFVQMNILAVNGS